MPERKMTIALAGRQVAVTDVPIAKASEPACEYELEDGSILRVRFTASSIARVDGEYEVNGDPIYIIRNGTSIALLHAAEAVKRTVN